VLIKPLSLEKQKTHRRFQRWVGQILVSLLPDPPSIAANAVLRHDAAQPYSATKRLQAGKIGVNGLHQINAAKVAVFGCRRQALIRKQFTHRRRAHFKS
jgi:hypothetical protein